MSAHKQFENGFVEYVTKHGIQPVSTAKDNGSRSSVPHSLELDYPMDPNYLDHLMGYRIISGDLLSEAQNPELMRGLSDEIIEAKKEARKKVLNKEKGTGCFYGPVPMNDDGTAAAPGVPGRIETCSVCGRIGLYVSGSHKYCCQSCKDIKLRMGRRVRYVYRNDEYKAQQKERYRWQKNAGPLKNDSPITIRCKHCGKEFTTNDRRRKYCSEKCAHQQAIERVKEYNRKQQKNIH